VFSGTVRDNLDPFNACGGDAAIWGALGQTGMVHTVNNLQVCFLTQQLLWTHIHCMCILCQPQLMYM